MTRLGAAALVALLISPAFAASEPPLPPVAPDRTPQVTPNPAPDLPPYQVKLERLAELLGTLTFMEDLCTAGAGAPWRGKMQDLLAAEGATDERRDRLAGSFNRGFDGYRVQYRRCTESARVVIGRALDEGSRLARDLSARFGS